MPRAAAASNSRSTLTLCTVGNTTALVVPWASSASRKRAAPARATAVLGVAHLGREGVGVQPVEQLGAVAGDDVQLRAVDVGVDEAGQDQAAGVLVALPVVAGRLVAGLRADDAAVLDQQPVVGAPAHAGGVDVAPGGRGGEVEQVAAQGDARGGGRSCQEATVSARGAAATLRATSRTHSRSQRTDADSWVRSCHSW